MRLAILGLLTFLLTSAGMAAGSGVYDLCFDWSRGAWALARVLD